MRIVLAGGTGFLGTALSRSLKADGHDLVILTRAAPGEAARRAPDDLRSASYVQWTADGHVDGWAAALDRADAVVNLAGESIAGRRWTPSRKVRLWDSRVQPTRGLAQAIAAAPQPPALLVSASAVGYYGDRGDEVLTEGAPPGRGFLARLAMAWETEAQRVASDRTRVALIRTGLVLDRRGGVLKLMLPAFRFFVGGPLGDGMQWMSWIHLADWVGLVRWILADARDGVFNATGPSPVRNREFAIALGRALGRPSLFSTPKFALRAALGEMADSAILASLRVVPERAQQLGYQFAYPQIDDALRAALAG